MNVPSMFFGATGALILGLVALQQRSDQEQRERLSDFMSRKLEHAEGALRGLSRHDLAQVAEHADKLGLVCLDLSWNVMQSDEYLERSTTFRRTIASLAKAARDDKVERAELAYLDLVGQCFSCHSFVRDGKKAK